jgi:hypothetical protein
MMEICVNAYLLSRSRMCTVGYHRLLVVLLGPTVSGISTDALFSTTASLTESNFFFFFCCSDAIAVPLESEPSIRAPEFSPEEDEHKLPYAIRSFCAFDQGLISGG